MRRRRFGGGFATGGGAVKTGRPGAEAIPMP